MASIGHNPAPSTAEEMPSVEARRALIERVAASKEFSRSVRLRDFLLYVGRQSLKEGCAEIHEQEIGAKVFGRPASYDRSSDNIVRVNATELRKRIDSYFVTAGAKETLIFEIPRGSYKPVFRWRTVETVEPAAEVAHAREPETAVPPGPHTAAPAWHRTWFLAWPLVSLALAVACVALFEQNRTMQKALRPWEGQPAVAAFWTSFLDSHRETDIVLPDDSASVIEDITNRPISLGDYLNRAFLQQTQDSKMSADRKEDVFQVFNHNLVTFGAVRAAQLVLEEIPPSYPRYLTLSRYFTADDIKRDNVVFVGGQKSVPWDHLFDGELNFITAYDYAHGGPIVRNRNPRPGEQTVYTIPPSPNAFFGYATVAYLPNPGHTGNVIILGGTGSDATGAAGAFLTSEDQMERFRRTLHVNRFPYFEALLKISWLSGTFFDAELIAYRSYAGIH